MFLVFENIILERLIATTNADQNFVTLEFTRFFIDTDEVLIILNIDDWNLYFMDFYQVVDYSI
jgi:hypothetical protein